MGASNHSHRLHYSLAYEPLSSHEQASMVVEVDEKTQRFRQNTSIAQKALEFWGFFTTRYLLTSVTGWSRQAYVKQRIPIAECDRAGKLATKFLQPYLSAHS